MSFINGFTKIAKKKLPKPVPLKSGKDPEELEPNQNSTYSESISSIGMGVKG